MTNYILSSIGNIAFIGIVALLSNQILHWFLLPIVICGIILGADAITWIRGQIDTFDVKGIIGLFGLHFFFFSPIIFIAADLKPVYSDVPQDWRYWFGLMGIINVLAISMYKLFEHIGQLGRKTFKRKWRLSTGRTEFVLSCSIAAAVLAQIYILIRFGGLAGIAQAQFSGSAAVFAGAGIPRMMSYAAPLLCIFGFLLFMQKTGKKRKSLMVGLILLTGFSFFQFIASGIYSSRGLVVTSIIWALILFHYFWRPISAKLLIVIFIPLLALNWLYAFYKDLGPEVLEYLQKDAAMERLETKTGRSFAGLLIGDLSRVDVQAYMLYRLVSSPETYDLKYGRTYLADFTPIIPYWIWRNKPANSGKVLAGTELLWGKKFYKKGVSFRRSNRAYGLAGEMMLNFGPYAVPFAYAVWGFLVGRFRRYVRHVPSGDLRFFWLPYFTWFIPNMLIWDLDNWLAHSMNRAVFPIFVVWLMAGKVSVLIPDGMKVNPSSAKL